MTEQSVDTWTASLLASHRNLDIRVREQNCPPFVSGWQTRHPFSSDHVGQSLRLRADPDGIQSYTFLSDSIGLTELIRDFHSAVDGRAYSESEILTTPGASVLLLAQMLHAAQSGLKSLHYAPPIYYTYYHFAKLMGLKLIPVAKGFLANESTPLQLPRGRTALILSDPIWITGSGVHPAHLDSIRDWQRATNSFVFLDGTFSYTQWSVQHSEPSANLDPQLTFRVVCPTKSLAVPGARFAYILLPPDSREDFRYICSNITGASDSEGLPMAAALMRKLLTPESNGALCGYIASVYKTLIESGVIKRVALEPSCTYYIFAELHEAVSSRVLTMDQAFFGVTGYPGFVRINLLYPNLVHTLENLAS